MNFRYQGLFAAVGASVLFACASPVKNEDRQPELAKSEGYYVSYDDSRERGGVGGYVSNLGWKHRNDVPQNQALLKTEGASTNLSENQTIPTLKDFPDTVHFDSGDSSLSLAEQQELTQIALELKKNRQAHVRIDGYADAAGEPEANLALSGRRAQSVKDYLIDQGVAEEQIRTFSHGDIVATGPDGNAQDRRAVIALTG
jgi:outer membrane protein OmpA-like peptidoglycan-associated protein